MPNKALADILEELFTADKVRMPVYPPVAEQVQKNLQHIRNEPALLNRVASRDPALVCNLFRAANSSFFQGLNKTQTLDEAITRLGLDKAAEIIAQACSEGASNPEGDLLSRYLPDLWRHAFGCGLGAQWLAERCGYPGLAGQAYLAGLLHDIGKLFTLSALDQASACGEFGLTLSNQLVEEVIITMHLEQGRRLLADWNLPEHYSRVILHHHAEGDDSQDIIVSLVRLANKGCHKIGLGLRSDPELVLPTTAEAQFLGIDEIALAEFEIMLEDQFLDKPNQKTRS